MEEFISKERAKRDYGQKANQNRYNMPEPEFKTTIIRILDRLEKSIKETKETLTTEIKDLKTSKATIKKML